MASAANDAIIIAWWRQNRSCENFGWVAWSSKRVGDLWNWAGWVRWSENLLWGFVMSWSALLWLYIGFVVNGGILRLGNIGIGYWNSLNKLILNSSFQTSLVLVKFFEQIRGKLDVKIYMYTQNILGISSQPYSSTLAIFVSTKSKIEPWKLPMASFNEFSQ